MSFDWSSLVNGINGFLGIGAQAGVSAWQTQQQMQYLYQQLYQQQHQYEQELQWQKEKYGQDMDFANRQLQSQIDIANKNFGLQQEQFQYQKDLNVLQMQREDNAFQRQMADLTKAGFSPLAAIGSNGAAAGSLNAGTAPQLDASGIATASGQYLDLARQYASLHADLNSKNRELQQGAAFAIAQMKQDAMFKGQSLATESFNAAVNASNKRLQNQSLKEDIQTKKYANDWYAEHGYSQTTLATVLSDFLNRDDVKEAKNKFMDIISNGLTAVGNGLESLSKSISELGKHDIKFSPNENKDIIDGLSEQESAFVLEWLKKNNKTLSDMSVTDWLNCAADEKKSRKGRK